MAIVLGIVFVVYGVGMTAWGTARHDIEPTDYLLYGFLALVGLALLIKRARDRRKNSR